MIVEHKRTPADKLKAVIRYHQTAIAYFSHVGQVRLERDARRSVAQLEKELREKYPAEASKEEPEDRWE